MMFNKRMMSVAFAFALVALSGLSAAQTIDPATQAKLTELETRFKAADKNADGKWLKMVCLVSPMLSVTSTSRKKAMSRSSKSERL
jgi:hypothetical protein